MCWFFHPINCTNMHIDCMVYSNQIAIIIFVFAIIYLRTDNNSDAALDVILTIVWHWLYVYFLLIILRGTYFLRHILAPPVAYLCHLQAPQVLYWYIVYHQVVPGKKLSAVFHHRLAHQIAMMFNKILQTKSLRAFINLCNFFICIL